MSAQPTSSNISKEVITNTGWASAAFFSGKLLNFLASLILARYLLSPEDFGLMGLCLVAIEYLTLLNTFGTGAALIARRDNLEEAANAAFIISLGSGILLYAAAWVLAPGIAAFFQEPRFVELFRVLALVLPINAIGIVPNAILRRSLRFKSLLFPDLSKGVAKGLISVGLAWAGFGVWSLIWGQVAGGLLAMLANWYVAKWRPTFVFDKNTTREILSYSWHIMSIGLIAALIQNVDYLFVGKLLGTTALGFYTLAYRLPELLIRSINLVVGKVAFPLLARLQAEKEKLQSIYLNYLSYIALVVFPAGAGLALIAAPLILLLYTDKWFAVIEPMRWISLSIAISAIGHIPGVLYKAMNRPDILNKLALIKLPIAILILWASTRWGIVGVAIGQVVMAVIKVVLDTVVVQWTIKIELVKMVKVLAAPFGGTLVMGLSVYLLTSVYVPENIPGLALTIMIGGSFYLASLMMLDKKLINDTRAMISVTINQRSDR